MKLLGSGKLSKVIKEIGDEVPNVERGLAKTTKEAEIAGEVGAKKAGSLGDRTYNTIDVDATDLSGKPSMKMGSDEAGFPQLKTGQEDPFAIGGGKVGVDDAADVAFKGKGNKGRALGTAAAVGTTAALGYGAYEAGKDGKTQFPARAGEEDPARPHKSSGPADPSKSIKPSGQTHLAGAEKYKEAYDELKLPDQSGDYAAVKDQLAKDINAANELYEQTKDQTASRELWDSIIQGVGHIAAGVYGQKTGLDLSGVKFNQTDWDKKRDLAQSELRTAIDNARQKAALSKDQIERAYGTAKDQLQIKQSQIEAAERRDTERARLEEAGKDRQDRMKVQLAELSLRAREQGDKESQKDIAKFEQMENKLDTLITEYSKKPSADLKAMVAAQVQQYEAVGKKLGIGDQDLRYTMADINSSDTPENIHAASMTRMAKAAASKQAPATSIRIRGKDGKEYDFNPETKQMTPVQ